MHYQFLPFGTNLFTYFAVVEPLDDSNLLFKARSADGTEYIVIDMRQRYLRLPLGVAQQRNQDEMIALFPLTSPENGGLHLMADLLSQTQEARDTRDAREVKPNTATVNVTPPEKPVEETLPDPVKTEFLPFDTDLFTHFAHIQLMLNTASMQAYRAVDRYGRLCVVRDHRDEVERLDAPDDRGERERLKDRLIVVQYFETEALRETYLEQLSLLMATQGALPAREIEPEVTQERKSFLSRLRDTFTKGRLGNAGNVDEEPKETPKSVGGVRSSFLPFATKLDEHFFVLSVYSDPKTEGALPDPFGATMFQAMGEDGRAYLVFDKREAFPLLRRSWEDDEYDEKQLKSRLLFVVEFEDWPKMQLALDRVPAAVWGELQQKAIDGPFGDDEAGSAGVTANPVPPTPQRGGGERRTFDEALALARNP